MDEAENEVHAASYEILSVGTDAGILCNVRKIQTEGAAMKPAIPKTELPKKQVGQWSDVVSATIAG